MLYPLGTFQFDETTRHEEYVCSHCFGSVCRPMRPEGYLGWQCYRCLAPHAPVTDQRLYEVNYHLWVDLPEAGVPLEMFGRVRAAYDAHHGMLVQYLPYHRPPLTLSPLAVVWNVALGQCEYSPRGWPHPEWLPEAAQRYLLDHPEWGVLERVYARFSGVISKLALPYGQTPTRC